MSVPSKFIVYGLIDPMNSQLRYIGLSSSGLKRPNDHIKEYKLYRKDRKSTKFTHCQTWLQKLVKNNMKPEVIVLEEFSNKEALNEAETFWISYFRAIGANLTNHQSGGYNGKETGWKHSSETIEKLKASAKARYERDPSSIQKAVAVSKSKPRKHTEETKLKMSKTRTGIPMYPKARSKILEIVKTRRKPLIDQNGKIYNSIWEAAHLMKTSGSHIRRNLRGIISNVKGFKFKLLEKS